ncbi:FAD-dependent oxidoreductase [Microbacterium xanthum]|uniref:FAD-dependent oxidoreductase n=1 Tax=Microbacterium xanthum TaxID=3079794 RepID=UPI002AD49EDC|nr:FAD-dependent oxidoreductase [Microbacterium sp. KSW-48]MDZ8170661.1 FAD-dependent oxidoreductase [Microbacterium sp. KSW-48]
MPRTTPRERRTDALVVGGGLGGISAALTMLRNGMNVVMTEPTRWIGGQLTSQLVPLDDHRRVESIGASATYRELRRGIRDYYRTWFPLNAAAAGHDTLNPGAAWVSPLSHDPRVGLSVLEALLMPFQASGQLTILTETEPVSAQVAGDVVEAVTFRLIGDDDPITVSAPWVVDATELGDLLDLADIEHVTGRESKEMTGEPDAADTADPLDMQSVTWCFAMDHRAGEDHTIDRPADYDFYRTWEPPAWGGNRILSFNRPPANDGRPRGCKLVVNDDDDPFAIDTDHRNMPPTVELWTYRRISARQHFQPGTFDSDVTIVNWHMNDYTRGPIFGVPDAADHLRGARQLSLSVLYWLQTEAPRPDGGTGWPGLRLRPDVAGTRDGLAMAPYIRESRRIQARKTIVQQEISLEIRGEDAGAEPFADSVGVGHYFWIDQHAGTAGRKGKGGRPHPFQIPLGALIPVRMRNVLPACKNIGTTHITNGSYRLHPVEWSIGEAAGTLIALCARDGREPHEVYESEALTGELQAQLRAAGVPLEWPAGMRW